MAGDEIVLVTLAFDATDPGALLGVLARYVVLSRQQEGCRNIDLCRSSTKDDRFVIIEKWASLEAQQAHFNSSEMVEMARACEGLLARRPDIDLLEGLSAYDLE